MPENGNQSSSVLNEVAVFIDLENLRYSLLNIYGQEPDFGALVSKAKKYGRPSLMKAYADFAEHANLRRKLDIAGIDAINVTVKRIKRPGDKKGIERVKNAADMILALDAIMEAVDADANGKTKVFLLVTGDADYIKLVTQLKNRFGQRVIIAGVPGSIGADLVEAAGEEDPIEVEATQPVDQRLLKTAIVGMIKRGPAPLKFWSMSVIDQWCQSPRQGIPGTPKEQRDAVHDLIEEDVLVKSEINLDVIGKRGAATQTRLNDTRARELGYLQDSKQKETLPKPAGLGVEK